MQRNTGDTQTLTVEYGFLDSTKDDPNQLKNNYKNLAEAVVRAVTNYIGANYIPVNNVDTYIVQKGDTLYSIARKTNTTVDKLKELNNLSNNTLSIGQVLKLPTKEVNNATYIVKSGDTLYSIARKNNTDVNTLKSLNNLTTNTISLGQVLKLPGSTISNQDTNYNEYIVQKGDSLYAISKKYGISVDKLKEYNNLSSNILSIGQIIKIPIDDTITYVVKPGDTLYSIASKNNTTVANLKSKNNLESNLLSIGQVLVI